MSSSWLTFIIAQYLLLFIDLMGTECYAKVEPSPKVERHKCVGKMDKSELDVLMQKAKTEKSFLSIILEWLILKEKFKIPPPEVVV